jgi:hypothetical protein
VVWINGILHNGWANHMTDDCALSISTVTHTINAPLQKVNIVDRLFNLPDAKYQWCSPAHIDSEWHRVLYGWTIKEPFSDSHSDNGICDYCNDPDKANSTGGSGIRSVDVTEPGGIIFRENAGLSLI